MRIYDHIDLRVRDRARAQDFYSRLLPSLGFMRDQSGAEWGAFDRGVEGKPTEFFGFTEDVNHRPNETRIAFWAETPEIVERIAGLSVKRAERMSRVHGFGQSIAQAITPSFLKIPTETNWKSAVVGALSLRIKKDGRNVTV